MYLKIKKNPDTTLTLTKDVGKSEKYENLHAILLSIIYDPLADALDKADKELTVDVKIDFNPKKLIHGI